MFNIRTLSTACMVAVLGVTGCQNMPNDGMKNSNNNMPNTNIQSPNSTMLEGKTPIVSADLSNFNWTLDRAVDSRHQTIPALTGIKNDVTLNFSQNNEVSFSAGCNSMGASYTLNNNVLQVNDVRSTLMMCQETDMAEKLLRQSMQGSSQLTYVIGDMSSAPVLKQTAANGVSLFWHGQPTAQAHFNQEGETVFFRVHPALVPCDTTASKKCLLVRPVQYDDRGIKVSEGEWQVLGTDVQNYTHKSDENRVIRMKKFTTNNGNATKDVYIFDRVIESGVIN